MTQPAKYIDKITAAPKAEVKPLEVEEPQVVPEGAEVVDMDDEDIKNIMGEL